MERPTCKTCHYFTLEPTAHPGSSECHYEPRVVAKTEDDFCSHHPDFKTYFASLKPSVADDRLASRGELVAKLKSLSPLDLDEALKLLRTREREVIRLAFGLAPHGAPYNRDEIARIFKVTRERARQIEEKAVKLLLARRT